MLPAPRTPSCAGGRGHLGGWAGDLSGGWPGRGLRWGGRLPRPRTQALQHSQQVPCSGQSTRDQSGRGECVWSMPPPWRCNGGGGGPYLVTLPQRCNGRGGSPASSPWLRPSPACWGPCSPPPPSGSSSSPGWVGLAQQGPHPVLPPTAPWGWEWASSCWLPRDGWRLLPAPGPALPCLVALGDSACQGSHPGVLRVLAACSGLWRGVWLLWASPSTSAERAAKHRGGG